MIVIADTSPINYLVLIGEIEILPRLYGRILVPPSVSIELAHLRSPEAVRQWISQPPKWLRVCATSLSPDRELLEADIEVGERDAILLAQELTADELIMDDMRGRREAERRRLSVTGTIGVLRAAAKMRLLDLHEAIAQLKKTNFRFSEELLARLIADDQRGTE